MKYFFEGSVIHLMKGSRKYVTILPYDEFKQMKSYINKFEEKYELRFKENLLLEILRLFKGDLDEMIKFIRKIENLNLEQKQNFSGCEKISKNKNKVAFDDITLIYQVNRRKRLITILEVFKI